MVVRQLVRTGPGFSFNCWPLAGQNQSPYLFVHRHADDELVMVDENRCRLIIGGNEMSVEGPTVIWIGADLVHAIQPAPGTTVWIWQIPPHTWEQLGGDLPEAAEIKDLRRRARGGLCWVGKPLSHITSLGRKVRSSSGCGRFAILFDLLAQLQNLPTKSLTTWISNKTDDPRLEHLLLHLKNDLEKPPSLDNAAALVGLSRSQLNRRLQQRFGSSYVHLLHRLRIERACHLLVETERSILDIQLEVGFDNQAQFNRIFKRLTGRRPSQWRSV